MKKYYKFGEMILAFREEYNNCKNTLEQLNNCINIEDYFGFLSKEDSTYSDRKIRLIVEKTRLDILKKIESLKYDWYSHLLYSAIFVAEKKEDGLYGLTYNNIKTSFDSKKYIPKVEIIGECKNFCVKSIYP